MKDPKSLWLTWNQAKQFSCRPSEILGVTDQPTSFYFDRAVFTFGTALDAELEKAGDTNGKKKKNATQIAQARQRVLHRWLGTQQKFADPLMGR